MRAEMPDQRPNTGLNQGKNQVDCNPNGATRML